MSALLGLIAAFGCAIFNGIAVILEKNGVDQLTPNKYDVNLLWQLKNNYPYIIGIIFDLAAWLLTIYAVHTLPLFIVQPIIALSIITTVGLESLLYKRIITPKMIMSFLLIVFGLILLTTVANTQGTPTITNQLKWIVSLFPLVLILSGIILLKIKSKTALAVLSGLSFGGVSIAGRALEIHGLNINLALEPLFWAIVMYGLVGIYFFTIALQRNIASVVNAIMVGAETIFPIIIGILFLGDRPFNNNWFVAIAGASLIIVGTIIMNLEFKFPLESKFSK